MEHTILPTRTWLLAAGLIALGATQASAQCTDDHLGPNDTCAQPTLVFGGYNGSLTSLYHNDDYFQIHVASGEDLTVNAVFAHSLGDLDLFLYDTGCQTLLASSTTVTDDESVLYTNSSGTGQDLIVRLTMYAPNPDILCNDYNITFGLSTTIACQDDSEAGNLDNDNCGDANLIFAEAVYLDMGVLDIDPDYYKLTVPDGKTLYVDLTFLHTLGDIDLLLYDSSCTNLLASATSVTDDESLQWSNTSGGPVEVKWNVYILGDPCNQYHMVASLVDTPCGPDDGFEDNDVCLLAAPLGAGTNPGLVVMASDPDYFEYQVIQGESLEIDASFVHANGDVDLRLWDACGGNLVDWSVSTTDNEHVEWTNTSGPDTYVYLQVDVVGGATCNNYDLVATLAPWEPGTNYCLSVPNSSGFPAVMSVVGTASIAANDLVLYAAPLPQNVFGLFYYGPNQIQQPFGDGFRCVGGQIFRRPVASSGAGGVMSHALDYTALSPAGAILAGSTWNFQGWFRDTAAGGAGFNLSDGYGILFTP